ncbi:DUF397 domain-containing protein [Actinomadura meyerae]
MWLCGDSKDVDGPMLSITPSAWASLITGVQGGSFDIRH